jgi:hypothetical protein
LGQLEHRGASPTNATLGTLSFPHVLAELRADAAASEQWLVDRDDPATDPRVELVRRAS